MPIEQMKLMSTLTQNENPRGAARGFSCLIILNGKTRPLGSLPFSPRCQTICICNKLLHSPQQKGQMKLIIPR